MSRWTFQVNLASILAMILCVVLGAAFVHSKIDAAQEARQADTVRRQLAGQLDESERRFMEADRELGKAESRIVGLETLERENAEELNHLRRVLNQRDLEIRRRSDAVLTLQKQITGLRAEVETLRHEDGAVEYAYRLPWFSFHTPDVFGVGGETLAFDIRARLRVLGIARPGGVLETETVHLTLTDPAGDPLPIQPDIESYSFEYAPMLPARPPWYRNIHLDLFGAIAAPYPVDWESMRIMAGAEGQFWGVTLAAWGETTPAPDFRAMLGIGYRWRAF